jgi:glycosyltransferase involved in cell wall biosynthesis
VRVAFDSQIFLLQKFGGVSRYFVELASNLSRLSGLETRVITPLHFNHHLQVSRISRTGIYIPFTSDILQFNQLMRKISVSVSKRCFENWKPDILHETFYSDSDPWSIDSDRVTTIHDLIREKYERQDSKSHRKKASILRASAVICVSDSTRNDLLEFYKLSEDRVHRVYVGVDGEVWNSLPTESPIKRNFILYVGHRNGYKNFNLLLEAFSRSSQLKNDFCIVAFGGDTLSEIEKKKIEELRLTGSIIHVKGGDAVLSRYYRAATVFVYPSLFEGFGSPNLEAMSSGCPVLCSDIPPFRESVGEAGVFFDPDCVESLRSALEDVLVDTDKRRQMSKDGLLHAAKFTWAKCAEETTQVYATVG